MPNSLGGILKINEFGNEFENSSEMMIIPEISIKDLLENQVGITPQTAAPAEN